MKNIYYIVILKVNLEEIINNISMTELKKFLYNNLMLDADLLDRFRVQFNS